MLRLVIGGIMDLEVIKDLIDALYRDFTKLSSREDDDNNKRRMYILITDYLKEIIKILRRLRHTEG